MSCIETVKLNSNCVLENVLYVPQFKFNLLSVSTLTKNNSMCLSFFSHTCVIQDVLHSRMIGKGRLLEVLYILEAGDSVSNKHTVDKTYTSITTFPSKTDRNTWHKRFGHLSFDKLNKLSGVLNFVLDCKATDCVPCSVCPLAKQR